MDDDAQFQDLTRRLAEAEQTLRAIFSGQADAVVYPVGGTPLLLHQAQEALLESEARYRGLVTRMSALVFEATPDGTLVFVNEALTPISGYRPEEVLGQNWWNLVMLPNQLSAALELLPHLKVGDVTGYEVTLRAKDGSPVTLELSSANRYAADGTLQRIVGLGMDRTRRKRTEQQRDQALHDLGERVKELTVLQHASRLLQDHTRPIAELLQELVELLPPAYQYPKVTSARIVLDDQEFATPNHAPSPWMLWANLGQRGIIEVCCLEERPAGAEGPFLGEERALLNTLAEMLGAHLERRQAEEERAASEIRFRTLTETTSAAIFIVEGLRILYANDAAQGITGYTCDELLNMELWQLAHPTYQEVLRQNGLKNPWGEAIPNRFELRVLTKGGEDRWWDVTTGSLEYEGKPAFVATAFDITERDRAEKALHRAKQDLEVRVAERTSELRETAERLQTANAELQVQAEELEVAGEELAAQNDELRAAQQTLEAERRRYHELFDFAPGGYLVTDLNGTIREANRAAARMLGVSAQRLEGKPLTVYVSEQEHSTLYARLADLQRTQTAQTWEMRLAPRQDDSFPALVDVAPARDAQGRLVGLRWLLRDITERKRAEEEIANLAKFPTENPNPILRLSRDGLILYANEASAPLLREWGCATGEYVPADWRDLTSQALASQSNRTVDVECSERIYSFSIAPIVERGYVNLYGRDITVRKRAEEALRLSEERFRLVLQNAPIVVANLDRDLAYTWIYNPKGGFRSEQVLGKPVGLSTDPQTTERVVQSLRQVLADGTPARWEAATQTPTGQMFFEAHAEALRNVDGEITGVALVSIDITERRKAEEALRESELRYRTLFETMAEGFSIDEIICDAAGKPCDLRYLSVNPAFERQTGLKAADILGRTTLELFPEAEPIWFERYGKVALTGEPAHFEAWFGPLGRCYEVSAYRTEPGRFAVVFFDITERKRAEEALRESEHRFRLALQNAPVSVAAQDRDLRFLWAYNQRTVDPGAVIGRTDADLFPPEDAAYLMALKRKVLETEIEVREQLWLTSGGQRVFLDLYLEPIRDAAGQVTGIGIATVDQTPMKLVEEALRESEEKYKSLVKYAPAAIYEMDLQGTQFLSVNDAMCDSLRYSKEELLSIKPADLLDPESQTLFQERIREKLAGERTDESIEYRIRRKDGEWIYAAVNVGAVSYTNKDPNRVAVIAYDITERKRAEEIKQHHAEELRAMNEELTRFNNAMVGRELRMVELKQEVNELCGRAGLPQRYALDLAQEGP